MAEDRGLRVPVAIDINAADKLDQLARLGPKVRPFASMVSPTRWIASGLSRISDAR